ncbi:hypothetical protein Tco_0605052, partial [Tanacetum coccineum]
HVEERVTQNDKSEANTAITPEGTPDDEDMLLEAPIYYHESGDLFAEEVEQHMAVLPEIQESADEIKIDDIQ